jgi:hypothetical protein
MTWRATVLVERTEDGRFVLTALGRLAGESAIGVETLLRAVDCLRMLRAEEVTDPTLIAMAQTSVELDGVYFPVNKRSTQKEPQHWWDELWRQGVARAVLMHMERNVTEAAQDTARAKKAAAWLYYVSGISMEEIERAMSQFGGAFGGSAGPIRSVTSRTCDVVPMIARAAEILHGGADLQERVARLLLRLELGIRGPAVNIARYAERRLDRGDYERLCDAGMTEQEALAKTDDAALLKLLGNDTSKVRVVRDAAQRLRTARPARAPAPPLLPKYEP